MSATTVQLLQAAAEIVGGNRALALELGVSEGLLRRFLSDSRELPDALLLRAVDLILADRLSRPPGPPVPEQGRRRDLSSEPEISQNYGRGSSPAFDTGGGG